MENAGKVMTVNGAVDPEVLGKATSHEHLFYDLRCYLKESDDPEKKEWMNRKLTMDMLGFAKFNAYAIEDNCFEDSMEATVSELAKFTKVGGKTVVDVTVDDFGRDVKKIKEAADLANIHVICGQGHYIRSAHPDYMATISVDELAKKFIDEYKYGVGDTGIRPGIIGELGTGYNIDANEIKCLKAAVIAQKETGRPIMVHNHPPVHKAHQVLDILEKEGADITHCVMAHVGCSLTHDDLEPGEALAYISSVAARGCYIGVDLCGNSGGHFSSPEIDWVLPSDRERARAISALCLRGYGKQILISQDTGHKYVHTRNGGWGFAHILTDFRDMLFNAGVTQYDYDNIVINNPARMLTIR